MNFSDKNPFMESDSNLQNINPEDLNIDSDIDSILNKKESDSEESDNSGKSILKVHFEISEQQKQMENIVNKFSEEITTDFSGTDSVFIPKIKNSLMDFINDFSDEYRKGEQEIKNMSASFSTVLPHRYRTLKAYLLNETSTLKTESFWDVKTEFEECAANPAETKNEKALVVYYIDRMLACEDIPDYAKEFRMNQKIHIQEEMQYFLPDDAQKIADEWKSFVDKNSKDVRYQTYDAKIEYFEKYIDYVNQILSCNNIPEGCLKEYTSIKQNAIRDMNNTLKEKIKEMSYYTVYGNFKRDIPDPSIVATLAETEMAVSYLELLLATNDIPAHIKTAWSEILEIYRKQALDLKKQ
jgi:hypothetical protein